VLYPGETSAETPGETPGETSAETPGETPGATSGATSGATLVEPVVVLLCGGNVDPLLLLRIIQSGMLEEGRYLALRTRLLDRPGALSRLLATLAQAGVNVLGVHHQRLGTRLGVLDVEVALEVETRGHGHIREVLDLLRAAGYPMSERA
jgi:threonine dehydratase